MPEFNLVCAVTVSAYTTVDAETLEEAIEVSETRMVVIGDSGSGEDELTAWVILDADGGPQNIHPDSTRSD